MLSELLSRILGKKETIQEQEYLIVFTYRYGLGETFATETEVAKMRRQWPEFIILGKTPAYAAPKDAVTTVAESITPW